MQNLLQIFISGFGIKCRVGVDFFFSFLNERYYSTPRNIRKYWGGKNKCRNINCAAWSWSRSDKTVLDGS